MDSTLNNVKTEQLGTAGCEYIRALAYNDLRSVSLIVTDAARFDARMLRDVVTSDNTASDVWADPAYRSQANEAWLKRQSRVSRIHRKKPRGKPMPGV